jgi:DNA-binding transcriptional LysR family regulator
MNYFDPISLSVFVAICEERSLTDAAERENLSLSAVSKRLAALEQQIGAALADRDRRRVRLTPAGEALLPAARALLRSMSRVQAHLSEYASGVQGHVRVAASSSAMVSPLIEDVAGFMRSHDSVHVSMDERVSTDVVRSVEEGRADFGVVWDATIGTRKLEAVPYCTDHLVVLAHRNHELARHKRVRFADTLKYELASLQGGSIAQLTQHQLAIAEGDAMRYHFQVRTYDSAGRIAAAGLALAIVPRKASTSMLKAYGLKAIALTDDWAVRRLVMCMRDRTELTAPARLLLDTLASRWYGTRAPSE